MPASSRFKTLYRNCLRKREDFHDFLQYNRIERCRMQTEKMRRELEQRQSANAGCSSGQPRLESPDTEQMHAMAMMQQQNSNKLNSSDAGQGNASSSLDTAHLEDTFLLGGAAGSASSAFENGSGTTVRPNQPILDISDDESVAEGGTKRVKSRQLEKNEQDSAVDLNNETFNTSEKRASTLLNLTHPVLSDGGIEGMAVRGESDRTQTLEDGPTLMNTSHPVPARGTTGDEPPQQQQQQVQDGQNEGTNAPGAAAVADKSSLLFDPSLSFIRRVSMDQHHRFAAYEIDI
uniref:Uncharacterized protein n=1 Tax=Globodera rostochiensis TaxID=31243 RepID=A0A914GQM0_GLORO